MRRGLNGEREGEEGNGVGRSVGKTRRGFGLRQKETRTISTVGGQHHKTTSVCPEPQRQAADNDGPEAGVRHGLQRRSELQRRYGVYLVVYGRRERVTAETKPNVDARRAVEQGRLPRIDGPQQKAWVTPQPEIDYVPASRNSGTYYILFTPTPGGPKRRPKSLTLILKGLAFTQGRTMLGGYLDRSRWEGDFEITLSHVRCHDVKRKTFSSHRAQRWSRIPQRIRNEPSPSHMGQTCVMLKYHVRTLQLRKKDLQSDRDSKGFPGNYRGASDACSKPVRIPSMPGVRRRGETKMNERYPNVLSATTRCVRE